MKSIFDMRIPSPKFPVGGCVCLRPMPGMNPKLLRLHGTILSRKYDNELHARAWQYEIRWNDGSRSNYYCMDLMPFVPKQTTPISFD